MEINSVCVGELKENTYVLSIGNDCLLIDPGSDELGDLAAIKELVANKNILAILCTHNHFDHIGAVHSFPNTPHFMHALDMLSLEMITLRAKQYYNVDITLPSKPFQELSAQIHIGPFKAEVLHTPGHSPGSVCFWFKEHNILISGDTLFKGTYGRTDLPGSSPEAMNQSLASLAKLPDTLEVYPGHGKATVLLEEKKWLNRL